MSELYYTAPSDEIFEEVKEASIKIWKTYDDQFGYATGKIDRIKDIENVKDNVMYMVAMFDYVNQAKLSRELSEEANIAIRERLIDGGATDNEIIF